MTGQQITHRASNTIKVKQIPQQLQSNSIIQQQLSDAPALAPSKIKMYIIMMHRICNDDKTIHDVCN